MLPPEFIIQTDSSIYLTRLFSENGANEEEIMQELLNLKGQKLETKMKKIGIQRRILNLEVKYGKNNYKAYKKSFFAVLTSSGSSDVLNELKADYSS